MKKIMLGAKWCCECRWFRELADSLGFEYIDTDEDCTGAVERYKLRGLPTFVIESDGGVLKKLEQPSTKEELRQFVQGVQ